MKTGRHITREISTINRIEETDIKDYYGKLPSGIVPLVLNRQFSTTTPWLTERHGYDPTYYTHLSNCSLVARTS